MDTPSPLKFEDIPTRGPKPGGLDVVCRLRDLAFVTYAVDPVRVARMIPTRFTLTTVLIEGRKQALVSVVSFINENFRLAVCPLPKLKMAQVNYRTYVIDRATGEKCVWFLKTVIDSWTVLITRYLWKLPWRKGKIELHCVRDRDSGLYRKYSMRTSSRGITASMQLTQTATVSMEMAGFPDRETGLIYLSQPLFGFARRLDGRLSRYRVWHSKINLRGAELKYGDFEFLTETGLVSRPEQQRPHSVMIGPSSDFTIYLPPRVID